MMDLISDVENLLLEQINHEKDGYLEDIIYNNNLNCEFEKNLNFIPTIISKYKEQNDTENLKKYYIMAIDIEPRITYYIEELVNIFWNEQNYSQFEQYCWLGIMNNSSSCVLKLSEFYYQSGKLNLMSNCLLIGVRKEFPICIYKYTHWQYVLKNFSLIEKYLIKAIDIGFETLFRKVVTYHYFIEKDYELVKIYSHIALFKRNVIFGAWMLGYYYLKIEKNYDKMLYYFLIGAENNCDKCIYTLGCYYHFINPNYELAISYYQMGVELGCYKSINNLGYYYFSVENYPLMKFYFNLGAKHNYPKCYNNLGDYYNSVENNLFEAIKNYLNAINNCYVDSYTKIISIINNKLDTNDLENYLRLVEDFEFNCENNSLKKIFTNIILIIKNKIVNN